MPPAGRLQLAELSANRPSDGNRRRRAAHLAGWADRPRPCGRQRTARVGRDGVAAAAPLQQPLALSAGTRRAIKGQDGLLKRYARAAIAASDEGADKDLAQLQRVRPRTLLVIAAC